MTSSLVMGICKSCYMDNNTKKEDIKVYPYTQQENKEVEKKHEQTPIQECISAISHKFDDTYKKIDKEIKSIDVITQSLTKKESLNDIFKHLYKILLNSDYKQLFCKSFPIFYLNYSKSNNPYRACLPWSAVKENYNKYDKYIKESNTKLENTIYSINKEEIFDDTTFKKDFIELIAGEDSDHTFLLSFLKEYQEYRYNQKTELINIMRESIEKINKLPKVNRLETETSNSTDDTDCDTSKTEKSNAKTIEDLKTKFELQISDIENSLPKLDGL